MVAVGLTFVVGDTAGAEVPVPSVTMPLRVTSPGVAAFWANAGKAAAIEISAAQRTAPTMGVTQPVSCPARQPPKGLDVRRRRNCSGLKSAENQRGDRRPDGPPKPK